MVSRDLLLGAERCGVDQVLERPGATLTVLPRAFKSRVGIAQYHAVVTVIGHHRLVPPP